MNKTITINLGGINFYIDEDAYIRLDNYLKSISASLDPESREETLQDIEARIAELFLEQQHDKSRVIQMQSIEEVIKIMGQPEDYRMEDEEAPKTAEPQKTGTAKKLYRDIEHRTIGGVCAGLGYYFGIERIWVRIIFLLLFLPILTSKFLVPSSSTVFLIYVILWIVVPAARTTSQKLEMQGEKIDINNIQRKVKEEYDTIKKKVENTGKQDVDNALEKFGNFLVALFKVLVIILGVILVIIAGIGLISVFLSFASLGAISFFGIDPLEQYDFVRTSFPHWANYFLLLLIFGIPFLLLIFAGLKIISPKSKPISLTGILILSGLWVLAFLPYLLFTEKKDARLSNHKPTSQHGYVMNHDLPAVDTLYIQKSNTADTKITKGTTFFKNVELEIKNIKENHLTIDTYTHLLQKEQRRPKANYNYSIEKDTLYLDTRSFIELPSEKVEKQETNITLYLKEGTVVKFDEELRPILKNFHEIYVNQFVQFKNGKMVCEDCPEKVDDTLQEEEKDSLQQENDSINTADKTNQNDQWYQESDSI